MKIALLAVAALMNARLMLFLKVIFIKLTPMYAPIAAPVQMFARLKQFIPNKTYLTGYPESEYKNPYSPNTGFFAPGNKLCNLKTNRLTAAK